MLPGACLDLARKVTGRCTEALAAAPSVSPNPNPVGLKAEPCPAGHRAAKMVWAAAWHRIGPCYG